MAFLIRRRPRPLAALAAAIRLVLAVLLLVATPASAVEGDTSTLERRVKAAFLYKFAGYVEWPADAFAGPDEPVVIGVVGADALADELEQLVAGRRVGNRPLAMRRLSGPDPAARVHILFVGRGIDRAQAFQLLAQTQGRPVLTVTEADGWLAGSVINFIIDNDKVRFGISAAAAEGNGLRLGSQLLAVAREVRRGPQ
jgi:uncharacterized protein DUF4154